MKKICVVTATRAEYGILKNLISLIYKSTELELQLVVSGTHLVQKFGHTVDEIIDDAFPISSMVEIFDENITDENEQVIHSLSHGVQLFSDSFKNLGPDAVLVLGDRFEILSVAQACLFHKIPLIHLHGGELTEGALDDSIRHAVTKLSHLHFVSNPEYRKRVIQLGERPERVFCVGAPGLDNMAKMELLSKEELTNELGIDFSKKVFLVTYHPVTMSDDDGGAIMSELTDALSEFDAHSVITMPNIDPGHGNILKVIDNFVASDSNSRSAHASLGIKRYLSVLKHCDVVIGNSSSGVIEAPFYKKPVVNIGDRQKGRIMPANVVQSQEDKDAIVSAITRCLDQSFVDGLSDMESPFGTGNASDKIFDIIKRTNLKKLIHKSFYDVPVHEDEV